MLGLLAFVLLVFVVLGYLLGWQWTGFPQYQGEHVDKRSVTLWAWISVLLVPLTLAVAGVLFTGSQQRSATNIQQQQRDNDLEVQERRAQDEGLREYIDKMGSLLLDEDLNLKQYWEKESDVARARTLTYLDAADALHRRSAIQFLYESDLITEGKLVVSLDNADLAEADLSWLYLDKARIANASLQRADLSNASLIDANLTNSILSAGKGAEEPPGVTMDNADLVRATLRGADLHLASLKNADLTGADLTDNGEVTTKLGGADFENTILQDVKLQGADLREVRTLTQEQIDQAKGDENTQLPDELRRPSTWDIS
jgi:uncharacterized protein YjbI with pentapeptide repeats